MRAKFDGGVWANIPTRLAKDIPPGQAAGADDGLKGPGKARDHAEDRLGAGVGAGPAESAFTAPKVDLWQSRGVR